MTVDSALEILQSALDRCRVDDIRTPGIYGTLTFLESGSAVKWPFVKPGERGSLAEPQRLTPRHPPDRGGRENTIEGIPMADSVVCEMRTDRELLVKTFRWVIF